MPKERAPVAIKDLCFIAFSNPKKAMDFAGLLLESGAGHQEAVYKSFAETADIVYQLTKIPIIKALQEGEDPRQKLSEVVLKAAGGSKEGLPEAVDARVRLFEESLEKRVDWQDEQWVWDKILDEEIPELLTETRGLKQGLRDELTEKAGIFCALALSQEKDSGVLLSNLFEISRCLGSEDELNLFRFMNEKQQVRIARGKSLTREDKDREWQILKPLADQFCS